MWLGVLVAVAVGGTDVGSGAGVDVAATVAVGEGWMVGEGDGVVVGDGNGDGGTVVGVDTDDEPPLLQMLKSRA